MTAVDRLALLVSDYRVTDWRRNTFRVLYRGLEELEAAMHVHLENNVLFPRALRQAQTSPAVV